MQTKNTFPKVLIFFYLIPYLAALLLTLLDVVLNYFYLDWFWLTEWLVVLPETVAYYLLLAMVFASFGLLAHYIFFGKTWQKWTISTVTLIVSFLFPFSRYIIRHFGYGGYLEDVYMLDMFYDDISTGMSFFLYCVIALLVVLTVCAYYAWILREEPSREYKIFSPKHPIGLAMLIIFAALAAVSVVNFFIVGEFSLTALLLLLLEFVIDAIGFGLAVFAAHTVTKWEA